MFEGATTNYQAFDASLPAAGERLAPGTLIQPGGVRHEISQEFRQLRRALEADLQAVESYEKNFWKRQRRELRELVGNKTRASLIALSLLSISVGTYMALVGWQANHTAIAQANRLSSQSAAQGGDGGGVPSSVAPSALAVSNYKVAPSDPRYLNIPKLAVHARVLALGTTKTGALAAPGNIFDTGWYKQSAKPGQNGAMLIDGHISNWQAKGVFYGLNRLAVNDTVSVERGDGRVFNYKVVKTQSLAADQVNMASLLVSNNSSKPGLNLISCSGEVVPGTNEFNKRLIIYTVQI